MVVYLIFIYILSCYGTFRFVQDRYYHKDGVYFTQKPCVGDIVTVFMPPINILLAFHKLVAEPLIKYSSRETSFFAKNKIN